jgi:iron(III) transport system substrate-binding protein
MRSRTIFISKKMTAIGILMAGLFLSKPVLAKDAATEVAEVVVYSSRMEQLIKPVFDAYTRETGVTIRFITDKEGPLLQRLLSEGENSPADLFITVDAGMLWKATEEKVFKPVSSPVLQANIPAHLRDPGHHWFGLSVRARTIVFHTKRVDPKELSTYEALGDPKWKKRLCLRTSKKVYNQSLVATMISAMGAEKTEKVVRSWMSNLATDVFPDDTEVMKGMMAGICDVGIVNSYYYGRLAGDRPAGDRPAGGTPNLPLALFWPNQNDRGVHVNISGAGVLRHAKHEKEAIKLLEWLSSEAAQHLFADVNLEYPANPKVAPHPTVAAWGTFKQDTINVDIAGKLQIEAVKLMDRVGYK